MAVKYISVKSIVSMGLRLAFLQVTILSLFAMESQSAEPAWKPLGLAGGGSMYALSASPFDTNLMMVACDMSADYISRDGGRNWEMIHHFFLQSSTKCPSLFDPERPGVVYAVDGRDNTLKISSDAGKTWGAAGKLAPWKRDPTRLYSDHGRFFVGTEDELWLSTDSFETWKACKGVSGELFGICADRARKGVYVAGTRKGVFLSEDGGSTFDRIDQMLPTRKITGFAGASDGIRTMLYVALECWNDAGKLNGGVYVSEDVGKTWKSLMHPDLNRQVHRSSEWANGDIAQYKFLLTSDRNPNRVYVYCPGTSYYPPNHNTIYRSDDGGKNWRAIFFSDPRFKGSYNVEDDRLTLSLGQRYQDEPNSLEMNPADPDMLMMSTEMFVFITRDGGKTWQTSQSEKPVEYGNRQAWPCNGLAVTTAWSYYIDPFEPSRHYICYTDICLARSLDAGKTWIWDAATPWKNTTYELAFDPAVAGRVWGAFSETHDIPNDNIISGRHGIIMKGGVALSDDHGETWKKLAIPQGPCVSVVLDPASPVKSRTLYASVFEKGVYKSMDGGQTWVLKNAGLGTPTNKRCCRLILHKDGTLFCLVTAKKLDGKGYDGDGPGIYRSTDGAASWEKVNRSKPLYWPKDFTVNPKDSKTVLVGVGNVRGHEDSGLYRTMDGGATWTLLAKKGSEHFGATYHPNQPGWIYMTMCEGTDESGLYLSRDDGRTWMPFANLPFANIMRVQFDPADPSSIILLTFGASVLRGPATP